MFLIKVCSEFTLPGEHLWACENVFYKAFCCLRRSWLINDLKWGHLSWIQLGLNMSESDKNKTKTNKQTKGGGSLCLLEAGVFMLHSQN